MAIKFIRKRVIDNGNSKPLVIVEKIEDITKESEIPETINTNEEKAKKQKNKRKKDEAMLREEQINTIEQYAQEINKPNVKFIKADKGLIERTESSKVVLTEDNRQVLND